MGSFTLIEERIPAGGRTAARPIRADIEQAPLLATAQIGQQISSAAKVLSDFADKKRKLDDYRNVTNATTTINESIKRAFTDFNKRNDTENFQGEYNNIYSNLQTTLLKDKKLSTNARSRIEQELQSSRILRQIDLESTINKKHIELAKAEYDISRQNAIDSLSLNSANDIVDEAMDANVISRAQAKKDKADNERLVNLQTAMTEVEADPGSVEEILQETSLSPTDERSVRSHAAKVNKERRSFNLDRFVREDIEILNTTDWDVQSQINRVENAVLDGTLSRRQGNARLNYWIEHAKERDKEELNSENDIWTAHLNNALETDTYDLDEILNDITERHENGAFTAKESQEWAKKFQDKGVRMIGEEASWQINRIERMYMRGDISSTGAMNALDGIMETYPRHADQSKLRSAMSLFKEIEGERDTSIRRLQKMRNTFIDEMPVGLLTNIFGGATGFGSANTIKEIKEEFDNAGIEIAREADPKEKQRLRSEFVTLYNEMMAFENNLINDTNNWIRQNENATEAQLKDFVLQRVGRKNIEFAFKSATDDDGFFNRIFKGLIAKPRQRSGRAK